MLTSVEVDVVMEDVFIQGLKFNSMQEQKRSNSDFVYIHLTCQFNIELKYFIVLT